MLLDDNGEPRTIEIPVLEAWVHDLNNLLVTINGYAEIGLENLAPGDPLYNELTNIRAAGAGAQALARQLFALSRSQDPKLPQSSAVGVVKR